MLFGRILGSATPDAGAKLHRRRSRICIQTVLRRIRTQKNRPTLVIVEFVMTTWLEKKLWRKKAFFCHLAARRRQKTCVLMTQQLFWHVLWFQLGAKPPYFLNHHFQRRFMGLQMEGFETLLTLEKISQIKIRLSFSYQISLKSRRGDWVTWI